MKKGNLRLSPLANEAKVVTSLAALTRIHSEAEKAQREQDGSSAVGLESEMGETFATLFNRYRAANAAWLATADRDGDIEAVGPEYEAAWEACKRIVRYQCRTQEEVKAKIKAATSEKWIWETSSNLPDFTFKDFLASLMVITHDRAANDSDVSIADLFWKWQESRNADFTSLSEEESNARYLEYAILQKRIENSDAISPSDVAMQIIATTDDGDSDYSDEFFAKMRAMTLVQRPREIPARAGEISPGYIATPEFKPSDIFYCLLDLDHQMQAIYDLLHELEYARQDGTRILELDRIAGMFRIASKEVERIRDLASVFDGPANLKNLLAGRNE